MPSDAVLMLAIAVMALIVYATRVGGIVLAQALINRPRARRLMEVLPGCALMATVAPAVTRGSWIDLTAVAVLLTLHRITKRPLIAILGGFAMLLLFPVLGLA